MKIWNGISQSFSAVRFFLFASLSTVLPLQAQLACLPTCQVDPNDAKFLAIAGDGLATLSDRDLEFSVSAPAGTASFTIGVFDGDSGSTAGGSSRWDFGVETEFNFMLVADPMADGSGTAVVPLDGQMSVSSLTLPNNGWHEFVVTADGAALAPSGNFFYRLVIVGPPAGGGAFINAFKLRSSGLLSIAVENQPFSYIAAGTNPADLMEVFPNGTPRPTTYDGSWRFRFHVPEPQDTLEIYEGDFDHGNADGSDPDTDDFNSAGVPPFSTVDAVPEGVAMGTGISTGDPPDDIDNSFFVRPGSVTFDVLYPDGQLFTETNPSGNLEWERFVGATNGVDADYVPTQIPAGAYSFQAWGVDYFNLNALRLPFRLICEDADGEACGMLHPYLVGDQAFYDANQSGTFDAGDTPIPGVRLNLRGSRGGLVASTTTDADGVYHFEVDAGTFLVEIDPSNFESGGALEGLRSTTGGAQQSNTVVVDNVLTYDFGYFGASGDDPAIPTLAEWGLLLLALLLAELALRALRRSPTMA